MEGGEKWEEVSWLKLSPVTLSAAVFVAAKGVSSLASSPRSRPRRGRGERELECAEEGEPIRCGEWTPAPTPIGTLAGLGEALASSAADGWDGTGGGGAEGVAANKVGWGQISEAANG